MCYLSGKYREYDDTHKLSSETNIIYNNNENVLVMTDNDGTIISAYKEDNNNEYFFLNTKAKDIKNEIYNAIRGTKSNKKGIQAIPSNKGILNVYSYVKNKREYHVYFLINEVNAVEIRNSLFEIDLETDDNIKDLPELEYTVLNKNRFDVKYVEDYDLQEDRPVIRSVEEVQLNKDLSWLKQKKYYVVNNENTVEKIIQFMENYNGPIVVDLETTGLKMNCFGKYGSKYVKILEDYNKNHEQKIYSDKIVGFVFCWKPNVSYYIPVNHKYFKNVYDDRECETTKNTIKYVRESIKKLENDPSKHDIVEYINNTSDSELTNDTILACRLREVLETKHMVAHNASFEWKSLHYYDIVLNVKDDTMLLHQIMYKFRSTTSNKGESSQLKDITHREFGADTCELSDFFPDFKEDKTEEVVSRNSKKKVNKIDFSYMTLEGTKVYAPADGDFTLQILNKYKKDLVQNHKNMEYLYNVEVYVSCMIGYMEFYGHRIDENKIEDTKQRLIKENAEREKKIRELGGIADDEEFNIASPIQMAKLFFERLDIPFNGDKISVSKSVLKQYTMMKNDDGTDKYPIIALYNEWKKTDTLLTKFFDNLQYFMYPGGYIFSHFGQISTATGRMSCSKPNCQQYPHDITDIVIPHEDCVMLDADYSQIEYRVLVGMAKENNLLEKFKDPDVDYHTLMASLMYNVPYELVTSDMRKAAKSFNFGIPYGMGFASLSVLLTGDKKLEHINYAKEKYEDYFREQPKVRQFFGDVKEAAEVNGYTVTNFGRRRYYSFKDKNGEENESRRARAMRQAGNAVIQGCIHGDTRIQTKEYGIVRIKDVAGQHLNVWDGEKWTEGDIMYSGLKQKCVVTFGNGQEIICSPIHKFLVQSHRGTKRFVECKDLHDRYNYELNPHRVVVNRNYEASDYRYKSDRELYSSNTFNSNNSFVDSIHDRFKAGVVLGRLASDGSIFDRFVGGSHIRQIIAEHEDNIYNKLLDYMSNLGCSERDIGLRKERTESIKCIDVYSKSLVSEISDLDIKHKVHDNIFMDTELLRGFLQGMFDGDGGISGNTINLVFGTQYEFDEMCRDIQKALLFLGIRCRYRRYNYRYVLTIYKCDTQKFLDTIGFLNENKQLKASGIKCKRDGHIYKDTLTVENVDITDEWVEMYDVCNTERGYYVADGLITHNTAADVFKIAMARLYLWIKQKKLFGFYFMMNMIHDEQLSCFNVKKLDYKKVIADVTTCMQMEIKGFPPFFVGAGLGMEWGSAKSKKTEIHPVLRDKIVAESGKNSLFWDRPELSPIEVCNEMNSEIYEFRKETIREYLSNLDNYHKVIKPAIGNLMQTFFCRNKETDDDIKETLDNIDKINEFYNKYTENKLNAKKDLDKILIVNHAMEYGIDLDLSEVSNIQLVLIDKFAKDFNYSEIDYRNFITNLESNDSNNEDYYNEEDDDDEYEDYDENEEYDDSILEYDDKLGEIIDENSSVYGASIEDVIETFGVIIFEEKKIFGINMSSSARKLSNPRFIKYLQSKECSKDDKGAMEFVLLKSNRELCHSGIYVKGIKYNDIEYLLGIRV